MNYDGVPTILWFLRFIYDYYEITDINELKYSFGGGLRYLFNKKEQVNLRMDIGIGPNGNTGIYFGIEEAF